MKFLWVLTAVLFLSGCVSTQYHLSKRPDANGDLKRYLITYGNYCGPGWPPTTKAEARQDTLLKIWPPVDDLDAACYAHDMCYAMTREGDANCDSAIEDTMRGMHRILGDQKLSCWNLATDVHSAFFGKFWSTAETSTQTASDRIVQVVIGVPLAVIWSVVKAPVSIAVGFPDKEGTCNLGEAPDPAGVIAAFNDAYAGAVFNVSGQRLEIPLGFSELIPATAESSPAPLN